MAKELGIKLFQFHYGTIKREQGVINAMQSVVFQFHYGTIKRNISALLNDEEELISIPLWYD